MLTFALYILLYWLIFTKISPRWSKSRDVRIMQTFFAAIVAECVISIAIVLFLLAFFPGYCYRP